jgi:hypothetical protein
MGSVFNISSTEVKTMKSILTAFAILMATPIAMVAQLSASASLPNQSGVISVNCGPGQNQHNTPAAISNTASNPATFQIREQCLNNGNGAVATPGVPANPLFGYYDALDAAFNPPSPMLDTLGFVANGPKPLTNACKKNPGKNYVILMNQTNSPYTASVYLCKKLNLGKMVKPTVNQINLREKTRANLIRATIWLEGQHVADVINWSQEGYGNTPLRVFRYDGTLMP